MLAQQVFAISTPREIEEYGLQNLWSHSFCTARGSEALLQTSSHPANQAYGSIAGLLHDVGKLILAHCLPKQYLLVLRLIAEQTLSSSEAEQLVFGTSHAAVGAYLALLWGLPYPVVEAIGLHHLTKQHALTRVSEISTAVWHANQICQGKIEQSAEQWKTIQQNHDLIPVVSG
jgi:HD-like signal output (HDOD) protein